MALRLPIVVSGRADDGAAWSEPTETDDISTSGALFHLNQKVSIGEKLYIRAHRPDVPDAFDRVIRKALEKQPAARWKSAAEMAAALVPFVGGA